MLRYRVDIIFKQEQNIVVLLRVLKSSNPFIRMSSSDMW